MEIQLEQVACNLCGMEHSLLLWKTPDRMYGTPGEFTYVRCEDCGLIYMNPRPTRGHLDKLYPQVYGPYEAWANRPRPSTFWEGMHLRFWKQPIQQFYASPAPGGRLLEIGCGSGAFLHQARQLGWEILGIEPSRQAANYARSQRIPVEHGDLESVKISGQFDLIRLSFVLEHIHDPLETLRRITGLLKPGGKAHIAVPNAASTMARLAGPFWYDLDAPRHLFIFTPQTFQALADKAGLQVEQTVGEINTYVFWKSLGYWLAEKHMGTKPNRMIQTWGARLSLPVTFPVGWFISRRQATSRLHFIITPGSATHENSD